MRIAFCHRQNRSLEHTVRERGALVMLAGDVQAAGGAVKSSGPFGGSGGSSLYHHVSRAY